MRKPAAIPARRTRPSDAGCSDSAALLFAGTHGVREAIQISDLWRTADLHGVCRNYQGGYRWLMS